METGNNEQTELLRAIWNEMKALGKNLGSRIDGLGARIDETNERLDKMGRDLGSRIDQTNVRLDHANLRLDAIENTMQDLATQQLMLGRVVSD